MGAAPVNTFAPDNAQTGLPGTTVFYAHTFNAGSAGSVAFSTTNIATPAVAGWTQAIYRDSDCSGTLNGAEGAAPLAGAVAVGAGGVVCIIVARQHPGGGAVQRAERDHGHRDLQRHADHHAHRHDDGGRGRRRGPTLAKAVRNVTQGTPAGTSNTARPSDVLEYAVTYTNTGGSPVSAIVDHRRDAGLHHLPGGELQRAAARQHHELRGDRPARGQRHRVDRLDARRLAAPRRNRYGHLHRSRILP